MLIFADGCDVDEIGTRYNGSSRVDFQTYGNRYGGSSYRITYAGPYLYKYLPSAYSTIIFGITGYWNSGCKFGRTLWTMLYNTTSQCRIDLVSSGKLKAYNTSGTLVATSTKSVVPSIYHHFEVKVYFHATAGSIEVRVNGETWINVTGVNTLGTAGGCNRIYQYFGSDDYWQYWDDFYVMDNSGSYNNDFLGDTRIRKIALDADTAQADFTLSTGTVGYSLLTSLDGDTSYVYSTTSGHKSEFSVANLGITPQAVRGVRVSNYTRKDDANSKQIRVYVKSGTATSSASAVETGTTYAFYDAVFETDPATSTVWDGTGVDGMTVGIEVAN